MPQPRFLVASAIVAALGVGSFALATPARAACDGPGPSIAAVRATAGTIVVGTVTWSKPNRTGRPSTWFDLRVDRAVRGTPGSPIRIRGRWIGRCTGKLEARQGDRMVLALDVRAHGLGGPGAASWTIDSSGRIVDHSWSPDATQPATLDELLARLAATPETSTVAPPAGGVRGADAAATVVGVVFLGGLLLVGRKRPAPGATKCRTAPPVT